MRHALVWEYQVNGCVDASRNSWPQLAFSQRNAVAAKPLNPQRRRRRRRRFPSSGRRRRLIMQQCQLQFTFPPSPSLSCWRISKSKQRQQVQLLSHSFVFVFFLIFQLVVCLISCARTARQVIRAGVGSKRIKLNT